jgi:hypothetical protein
MVSGGPRGTSAAHVQTFIRTAQRSILDERVEHNSARRRTKTKEASGLCHVQAQPRHFVVRPDDHRDQVIARGFSGDGVPGT